MQKVMDLQFSNMNGNDSAIFNINNVQVKEDAKYIYSTYFTFISTIDAGDGTVIVCESTGGIDSDENKMYYYELFHQDAIKTILYRAYYRMERLKIELEMLKSALVADDFKEGLTYNELMELEDGAILPISFILSISKVNSDCYNITIVLDPSMKVQLTWKPSQMSLKDVLTRFIAVIGRLSSNIFEFYTRFSDNPEVIYGRTAIVYGLRVRYINQTIDICDRIHSEQTVEDDEYIALLESCLQ